MAIGAATLRAAYAGLPGQVRARLPLGVEDWLRSTVMPVLTGAGPAGGLEARLWGGFSRPALAALAALAEDPAAPPRSAAAAAMALARWHGATGDPAAALARLRQGRARLPALGRRRDARLLEILFLCRAGAAAEARACLDAADADGILRAGDISAALMRANVETGAAARLAAVNRALAARGLSALAQRDPARAPGLDNLRGTVPAGSVAGPLVTVIVPAFEAEATLPTALDSLAAQTWAALEVLVVDDASGDGTAAAAAGMAARDPRFRLLVQPENGGAYLARNRALAEARGAVVTVQDADDWAHPERIARHMADLQRRNAAFNLSDWARATPELQFFGPWQPTPNLVGLNFSALAFRRELIARCGPWDSVRISADREFAGRLEKLLGLPPQGAFLPGAPLAFGRSAAGSLTRSGATQAASIHHGLRRDYREAAAVAHADLAADAWAAGPPYAAAPWTIRPDRGAGARHDLLFLADCNLRGGAFQSALAMIRAARAAGLDCALLHYRRYDLDPTRVLDPDVRRFAARDGVRLVSPGERLSARAVVVTYPAILDQPMDRFPEVAHERLAVVVNQMAERDTAGTERAYDIARVRANLSELLGSAGSWIPISARVRALMAADPRYPAPDLATWTPLLDLVAWPVTARWRGGDGGLPVLGRHGRDDALKWPRDPGALAAAYCAGRPCEVRFLGGARHARARLRRRPRNWREEAFGARDPRDFLAGLDVFLHFPAPDYTEEFGRAPMEAMAVGLPVILPPEFAPTFGAAALYTGADGVWPLVERLWADRAFWEARSAAGRAFVEAECSFGAFPGRFERLLAAGA